MNWKARVSSSGLRMIATALVIAVSAIGVAQTTSGDEAKDALEAKQLVEQAKATMDGFAADKQIGKPVHDLIKKAAFRNR